jgi:hypothetical protein
VKDFDEAQTTRGVPVSGPVRLLRFCVVENHAKKRSLTFEVTKMTTKKLFFKTSAGREIAPEDVDTEIVRLAHEKQALAPTLAFAAARDLVMRDNPELAKAWLGTDED